ncbi:MAG: DDE-type integrase/transposase/recombinase, partial [Cyanobacteria bacterium J06555_13]
NACYTPAIKALKKYKALPKTTKTKQIKYLNNLVEQDHRVIKRRVKPGLGFGSFNTARRTLKGYEVMNMIRKGQITGTDKGDVMGQISFINTIFGVSA